MKLSFLYAYRLVKQSRKFFLIALLNISLGLLGLFVLQNFKFSIEESVQSRVLALMGSHLSLSSRTEIPESEVIQIESELPAFEKKETQSFYTMMKGPLGLRLVQVIAQDAGYPFFGGLELRSGGLYPSEVESLDGREALLFPELQIQLGVQLGEHFQIGDESYIARDFIENDLGQSFNAFSLAPRVYISLDTLESTNLIQKGSIVRRAYHYSFDQELSPAKVKELEAVVELPGLRLSSPEKNGDQVSRILNYLNDFLGLSSLMAFTLVCIGLHYYYKSQSDRWSSEVALLKYLGVRKPQIFFAFLFFMGMVAVGGASLTFVLGAVLSPFLQMVLGEYLGNSFSLNFYWETPLIILGIAILGNVCLSFPIILPVLSSRSASVFNEKTDFASSKRLLIYYIPFLLFMLGMAIGLSNSLKTGSLFIALIVALVVVTSLVALLVLMVGASIANRKGGSVKLSMRYLTHFKVSTLTMVTSLSLSIGLMVLIPGLKTAIEDEIIGEGGVERPSFFLFDIQDEQVDEVREFFSKNDYPLSTILPMVRSRILTINGKEFTRSVDSGFSREDEARQRFRNRVVNLSYGEDLPDGDRVLEGRWFTDSFNWETEEWAELSIEKRYAKRLGMALGDRVEFEVLGMPVKAEITSIRKVKWTRFNPNFFLVLQPGVLENAPKTWLGSTERIDTSKRVQFQEVLFQEFPNVSVVDVEKIATRIFSVISQMTVALLGMSFLSLVVAFIVLGTLIYQKVLMRRNDLGLLKILGMTEKRITRLIVVECMMIAILACVVGGFAGLGLIYTFSTMLFDATELPFSQEYWVIPTLSILVSVVISYAVIRKLQKSKDFYRQVF